MQCTPPLFFVFNHDILEPVITDIAENRHAQTAPLMPCGAGQVVSRQSARKRNITPLIMIAALLVSRLIQLGEYHIINAIF